MRFGGATRIGCGPRNNGFHADKCWFGLLRFGRDHRLLKCRTVDIAIGKFGYINDFPAVGSIPCRDILIECNVSVAFDRDSIVVVSNIKSTKCLDTSDRRCLRTDAFFKIAVRTNDPYLVVKYALPDWCVWIQ